MKVAVFNTKSYDRQFLESANQTYHHELHFFTPNLTPDTAILAAGFPAVCVFINDSVNAEVITQLSAQGTQLIATRSAGFNHIDLVAAKKAGITIVRVPAYSPYAVAEHAVGLILTLNRKIHRAYNRVRDDNFSLEGLLGFDLQGATVGIVGTGAHFTVGGRQFLTHFNGFLILARNLFADGFGCKTDAKLLC